ncbi:MAG: peptidoglycan DD-metalloendopeptidase family protein [Candidatus Omnitrophica bacterium]|nr:peptidoglycan DD-metalloendopeptidase family protein [Candidatus Omnitrophota bacterium]
MPKSLIIALYFLLLTFAGCATEQLVTAPVAPQGMPGFFHHVEKGQTLWRISKMYGIDLDNLVALNHISDATKIEVGQQIFIPREEKPQEVVTLSQPEIASGEDFIWPVKGRVIGTFNQALDNLIEKGIEIRAYDDPTVNASRSGRVVFYNPNFKRYGKTIIIDHSDGFLTVYARNQEVLVKIGEIVKQGDPIAKANLLHFEIRKGHLSKNPLFYLP